MPSRIFEKALAAVGMMATVTERDQQAHEYTNDVSADYHNNPHRIGQAVSVYKGADRDPHDLICSGGVVSQWQDSRGEWNYVVQVIGRKECVKAIHFCLEPLPPEDVRRLMFLCHKNRCSP